jgi:phosphoserine phosphatase RsbU/P
VSAHPPPESTDLADSVARLLGAVADLPMDRLPEVENLVASAVGAREARIYVADYGQHVLRPLRAAPDHPSVLIDSTILGRVFQSGELHHGDDRVVAALVDGHERLGVVEYSFPGEARPTEALLDAVGRTLMLVLLSRRRYTDLVPRARRAVPLATAAEMQWDLLPPLACLASRASIAGMLEPAYSTGGDSFDYAVNGDQLDFIVIDAVGHGMPAVLKAMAAITTYRNVRRERGDLTAMYDEIGRVMVDQFGHRFYVTGMLASLCMTTGELTWINAGHPQPLLVRDGSAMPELRCPPSLPMGLGGAVVAQKSITLQPGDRMLVFTDGVVERRPDPTASPYLAPLTDLLVRATLDGLPGPETVRRLARSVLESSDGHLHDDATIVLVDFG